MALLIKTQPGGKNCQAGKKTTNSNNNIGHADKYEQREKERQ